MSKLYIYFIFLGIGFPSFIDNETGWSFDQSTSQAFYYFETIEVDGDVVIGDGSVSQDCEESYCCQNLNSCDVVGVFFNEICIGWVYADSSGYTTVPANGNDGGEYSVNYPNSGDSVYFRLYDASEDRILHFDDMICTDPNGENPGPCEWHNFGMYFDGSFLLDNDIIPADYSLLSAYPNPFNPSLNIDFFIDYSGLVDMEVYDLLGNLVETLIFNEFKVSGNHQVMWNPENITSGEYIIRLSVNGNQIATQKVAYIK